MPSDTGEFVGKVVIVTGGAKGVGQGIAAAFAASGAQVVTCGRHPLDAEAETSPVASDHGGAGRIVHVVADVRHPDEVRALVASTVTRFGQLDVLVNNAGGSPFASAAETSPRLITSVIALNLIAPFYCAQAAYPALRDGDGGAIVNIGSISGLRPSPGTAAYGAAKAGLINLTETLAVEWAPEVRINCISAGLLDAGGAADHYGGDDGMSRVAATVPLQRFGTPDEVADACLYLASSRAGYVTGANLVLHGGGEWPAFLQAAKGE